MALKQNECHLLGRKPYFQSLGQHLPFNLGRFKFDGFFKKTIFLLIQGQGSIIMEKKNEEKGHSKTMQLG